MTPPWQEPGPVIPSHGLSWKGFTYCPGRGCYSLPWHQLPEKTLSCGVWNVLLALPDKLEVPKLSVGGRRPLFSTDPQAGVENINTTRMIALGH